MMNKYVVSFVSFHDNDHLMEIVFAESEVDAALVYAKLNTDWDIPFTPESLEELKDFFFDGDCLIDVIRVD